MTKRKTKIMPDIGVSAERVYLSAVQLAKLAGVI